MALTLPTNVVAGNTGHINAHNTLHQLSNGLIFSSTAFYIPATSVSDSTAGHLMLANARGANSGVAPLDGGGLLPAANLPTQALRSDIANTLAFGVTFQAFSNGNPSANMIYIGGRGGGGVSPLQSGDIYTRFTFGGQFDTVSGHTVAGALIAVAATENFAGSGGTPTNAGSKITFSTVPNGTVTPVLAMTIGQDQTVTCAGTMACAAATIGALFVTGGTLLADSTTIQMGTAGGAGVKIGTATTQKIGFFNATPIVQYATTGTSTGFTAGGGTAATSLSTFTGNTGSTAYTVSDVVRGLKLLGLFAA